MGRPAKAESDKGRILVSCSQPWVFVVLQSDIGDVITVPVTLRIWILSELLHEVSREVILVQKVNVSMREGEGTVTVCASLSRQEA